MKKLMTLMGVTAFALGAFADAYVANKVGFENYTTGSGVTAVTEDTATTIGAQLWYCADGDGDSKVEEYGEAAKYDYGSSDNLLNGPGSKYLSVSTSGNNPLYRALADTQGTALNPQSLDGDIVADTLVQFTASPTAQTPETGAKFALWLLGEDPAEVTGRDPVTNLVVTAGGYDGYSVTPQNFNLEVEGVDVSPEEWHRVTVRAINGIADDGAGLYALGFVVYIDGVLATCADADYATKFGEPTGELTTEALILKDSKKLFLSLVSTGNDARKLAGVGFQGTGKVDDLSIVDGTEAPSFVAATTGFIITWSDGVESFKVGADTYTTANKDYVIVEPVGGAVAITDVVYANSYSKGTWTADGATLNGETFTLSGNIASGKIVATTSVFEIDGQTYETLGAALLAAGTAGEAVTIKAVNSFNASADFGETSQYEVYEIGSDVILDLAGCTITDDRDTERFTDPLFSVGGGATLVVIDSEGGGKLVAVKEDRPLFYTDEGVVIIGATTGDEGVKVDGGIKYEGSNVALVRGFFNDTGAAALVAEGSTISAEPEAGFYTVAPGSTPEPTTYTVTFVDYDGTELDSDDVEEGVTPTAPTAPTRTGYTFAGWEPTIEAVTSNTTYTATYSANTYTVRFYTNSVEYATATYTYGDASTYTAPSDPVVDGFKFGGWFTDDGTFKTEFVFSANVAGNTQVAYAKLTESGSYPSYIPADDAVKAKYDAWATYAGVTTAAAAEDLEEAYLLNCKPDEVEAAKAAFKFTSIYKDGDKWVTPTTTSYKDRDYNGKVTVKSYSDVGCTTESETGTFFRATLTLQ